MIYAGIGSRETPQPILDRMERWGEYFAHYGFTLRSGHARGADQAFEIGHRKGRIVHYALTEIFLASDSKLNPHWLTHAARFHPAWERCSEYAKMLHARNSAIILGASLAEPVDFVLCWTKDGKATGGTGQALRIAEAHQIKVFNLFNADCEIKMREWLGGAMS